MEQILRNCRRFIKSHSESPHQQNVLLLFSHVCTVVKKNNSFVIPVRLSPYISPAGRIYVKFYIGYFYENLLKKSIFV